jgi:hypothetical protein
VRKYPLNSEERGDNTLQKLGFFYNPIEQRDIRGPRSRWQGKGVSVLN